MVAVETRKVMGPEIKGLPTMFSSGGVEGSTGGAPGDPENTARCPSQRSSGASASASEAGTGTYGLQGLPVSFTDYLITFPFLYTEPVVKNSRDR